MLFLLPVSLSAQIPDDPLPKIPQGGFPDWMDKASVPGSPRKPDQTPLEPIDPSTQIQDRQGPGNDMKPVKGPRTKSRFYFVPPNIPDFSKFRKMGTRTTYQKTASGSELSSNESFEVTNLRQEERAVSQLASACQALPAGPERDRLEQELFARQQKLEDLKEMESLSSKQGSGTPNIQHKLRQMRQISTPSGHMSQEATTEPMALRLKNEPENHVASPPLLQEPPASVLGTLSVSLFPQATASRKLALPQPATPTYKIPDRFYRPERPTSLYLEKRRESKESGE